MECQSSKDVSFVEAKYVLGDNFGQSFGFYPFAEVVGRCDQIFVLIGPYHKWAKEV